MKRPVAISWVPLASLYHSCTLLKTAVFIWSLYIIFFSFFLSCSGSVQGHRRHPWLTHHEQEGSKTCYGCQLSSKASQGLLDGWQPSLPCCSLPPVASAFSRTEEESEWSRAGKASYHGYLCCKVFWSKYFSLPHSGPLSGGWSHSLKCWSPSPDIYGQEQSFEYSSYFVIGRDECRVIWKDLRSQCL